MDEGAGEGGIGGGGGERMARLLALLYVNHDDVGHGILSCVSFTWLFRWKQSQLLWGGVGRLHSLFTVSYISAQDDQAFRQLDMAFGEAD